MITPVVGVVVSPHTQGLVGGRVEGREEEEEEVAAAEVAVVVVVVAGAVVGHPAGRLQLVQAQAAVGERHQQLSSPSRGSGSRCTKRKRRRKRMTAPESEGAAVDTVPFMVMHHDTCEHGVCPSSPPQHRFSTSPAEQARRKQNMVGIPLSPVAVVFHSSGI